MGPAGYSPHLPLGPERGAAHPESLQIRGAGRPGRTTQMIRRLGAAWSVMAAVMLLLVSAGTVAAHDASATMTCGEEQTVVNVDGSGYPEGSTYTVAIDGAAALGPFDANTGGTAVHNAGSPTVAHTAVVTFTSSDGKTQF